MQNETRTVLSLPQKPFDRENGHEVILKTIKSKRQRIEIVLKSGDVRVGELTQFDNSTITIRPDGEDHPITLFKHAIESFTTAETQH